MLAVVCSRARASSTNQGSVLAKISRDLPPKSAQGLALAHRGEANARGREERPRVSGMREVALLRVQSSHALLEACHRLRRLPVVQWGREGHGGLFLVGVADPKAVGSLVGEMSLGGVQCKAVRRVVVGCRGSLAKVGLDAAGLRA